MAPRARSSLGQRLWPGQMESGQGGIGQARTWLCRLSPARGVGRRQARPLVKLRALALANPLALALVKRALAKRALAKRAFAKQGPLALVKRAPGKSKTASGHRRVAAERLETTAQRRKQPDR